MGKYTKGPWYESTIDEVIHIQSASINEDNYVCGINLEEDGPNAEANARLIAAAPELLEACKQAKNYINKIFADERGEKIEDLLIADLLIEDLLIEAIAKATGE